MQRIPSQDSRTAGPLQALELIVSYRNFREWLYATAKDPARLKSYLSDKSATSELFNAWGTEIWNIVAHAATDAGHKNIAELLASLEETEAGMTNDQITFQQLMVWHAVIAISGEAASN